MTYQVAREENPMALDKDALSELLDALRAAAIWTWCAPACSWCSKP